jgi:4-hydroxybenzoate polyprenyltransferase
MRMLRPYDYAVRLRDYVIHLRLPFQFLLSPVFLWGYLLAGGMVNGQLLTAYLAFHLFGYAGGTALNSYYDRDEGPIGGLTDPPPVPPHLLAFALVWQAIGFLLALGVNLTFATIYIVMFWMSLAYSHPRTRLKGKPLFALATVALGQGVLAFLGGWSAAHGEILSAANPVALLGALTATLLIVGFYPLTASYQIEADAARGDWTTARFLGVRGSFRFARACIAVGGLCAVLVVAARFSVLEAVLLIPFVGVILIWIQRWSAQFDRLSVRENFRMTMNIYAAMTLPFLAWIVFRLLIREY